MTRYMLLFVGDDDRLATVPEEERRRTYAAIGAWWDDLAKKGVIKSGEELGHRDGAMTVRRAGGGMRVTDGPFIESKEHVGGYALVDVRDLDAAIALAKSWPGGDVEVRPVVEH